jgi:hypothetical protein
MKVQHQTIRANKTLRAKILKDLSSKAVKNGEVGCMSKIALKHNVSPKTVSNLFRKEILYT